MTSITADPIFILKPLKRHKSKHQKTLWILFMVTVLPMLWGTVLSHAQPNYERRVIDSANDFGSAVVSDIDRDGAPDIVTIASEKIDHPNSSEYQFDIRWYQNQSGKQPKDSSGFSDSQILVTGVKGTRKIKIADLNGDGLPDLVSASTSDNEISWYENQIDSGTQKNNGFGSEQVITTAADNIITFDTADLDGDGDIDILSGTGGADAEELNLRDKRGPRVVWYENEGSGTFRGPHVITKDIGPVQTVHVSDLDEDGDLDVVTAAFGRVAPGTESYKKQGIVWYENRTGDESATNRFGDPRTIAAGADLKWQGSTFMFHHVTTTDLDADGDQDVIHLSDYNPLEYYWQENRIRDASSKTSFGPLRGQRDVNEGPHLSRLTTEHDPVEARGQWDDGVFTALLYTGFFGSEDRDIDGTGLSSFSGDVYVEDLDGDGFLDVIASDNDLLSWYENRTRAGNFECFEKGVSKEAVIEKHGQPDQKGDFTRIIRKWIYDIGQIRAQILFRDGKVYDCDYDEKSEMK